MHQKVTADALVCPQEGTGSFEADKQKQSRVRPKTCTEIPNNLVINK
jgi:hypothetical protein